MSAGEERWKQYLEAAPFLVGAPPVDPLEPRTVVLELPGQVPLASAVALEYDGYALTSDSEESPEPAAEPASMAGPPAAPEADLTPLGWTLAGGGQPPQADPANPTQDPILRVQYTLAPPPSGMWELGADFHWGLTNALIAMEPMQLELYTVLASQPPQDWVQAYSRFEAARKTFRFGRHAEALQLLEAVVAGDAQSPAYVSEWRVYMLLGVLRLGFAGGDLSLVHLASAQSAFLTAAYYAREKATAVSMQATTAAAFCALLNGDDATALEHVDSVLAMEPPLPEALFLRTAILAGRGDVQGAIDGASHLVASDRGYLIRMLSRRQSIVPAEHAGGLAARLSSIFAQRGRIGIQESLNKVGVLRQRAARTRHEENITRLEAFVAASQPPPPYDTLQLMAERETMVGAMLQEVSQERFAISDVGTGPAIEAEETYTTSRPTREKVVHQKGNLFRKEDVEWVTTDKEVTRTRTVTRPCDIRTTSIHDGPSGIAYQFHMLHVLRGHFTMGSAPDAPGRAHDENQHSVTLMRDFWISNVPVTQHLWYVVMGANPSFFQGWTRPVEQVSWWDAITFCNALSALEGLQQVYLIGDGTVTWLGPDAPGYRLATEAEWEYACRAGTETAYACGHDLAPEHANFERRHGATTMDVAKLQPNPWFLHGMHGNVWEWCWDSYQEYDPAPATDPSFSEAGAARVARGGSWATEAAQCRSAARANYTPWHKHNNVGFRIALTRLSPNAAPPTEDPE